MPAPPARSSGPAAVGAGFSQLGLRPELARDLVARGIVEPFPIQALAIPDVLAGRDVCGKAETGSGKTLAFGLPLLERLGPAEPRRPGALVLVPTRELARQIADVLGPLAPEGVRVGVCYGGAAIEPQSRALREGVELLVATPGRTIDLLERGDLELDGLATLVLDEADRMCDMGFFPQVEWILRRMPGHRQTLLFSATLDGAVDHLVKRYLQDPVRHEVISSQATIEHMEHRFLAVHALDRVRVVRSIAAGVGRTIVFVRTKRGVDRLARDLRDEGVRCVAIHGDLQQSRREKAIADFAAGRVGVLVATDVAARGIDVDGIDVVVHFDPPEDHKAYLHRSGRTARAGEAGMVVTFVLWDQRIEVERVKQRLGLEEPILEVFSNDPRLADLSSLDTPTPARRVELAGA